MIKFAHLEFTKEEFKKQHLKIMPVDSIIRTLKKIHKWKMWKQHSSYCWDAVWRDMQERCIIFVDNDKVLLFGHIYEEMLEIYKKKFSDVMSFYHIKTFNPIMAMFTRNQVSEC